MQPARDILGVAALLCFGSLACSLSEAPSSSTTSPAAPAKATPLVPSKSAHNPDETAGSNATEARNDDDGCIGFGPEGASELKAVMAAAQRFMKHTGPVYQATEDEGCRAWRFKARPGGVQVWLPEDEEADDESGPTEKQPCSFEYEIITRKKLGADAITGKPMNETEAALAALGCSMGDVSFDRLLHATDHELRTDGAWLFLIKADCEKAVNTTKWSDGYPCVDRN